MIFPGLLYGIIAMLLAFIAQYMGAIYAASFAVTGVTTGAIICIFSMGAFMPFVNKMVRHLLIANKRTLAQLLTLYEHLGSKYRYFGCLLVYDLR